MPDDYIHSHARTEMPRDQEEQRRIWREMYAITYPPGFKRRRNAEQTRLQRVAQRRYQVQATVTNKRRLQRQVRDYLAGKGKAAANIVGCSQAQFKAHLERTLGGAVCLQWKVAYHRPPKEFDLTSAADQAVCFHYANMYATPVDAQASSLCPSQLARSPTGS